MRTKMTMLILVLLGIMWGREAQAFNNPSTGRWLSRDSIDEGGGMKLYTLVGNHPIGRIDKLGCVDFIWRTPNYLPPLPNPLPGPGGGLVYGATRWLKFEPRIRLWQRPDEPCCWGLAFDGNYAQVEVWWALTYPEDRVHELDHVRNHFCPAYLDYKNHVSAFFPPCKTKAQALCPKAALEGPLRNAYYWRANRDAKAADCTLYSADDPTVEICRQAAENAATTLFYFILAGMDIGTCLSQ